ncbi:MAG: hypothetical protein JKX97_00970 [Candidatus Lindowbacteria bacterium]|nr:hypothetical protein [Candidatus Lindowbacteria bacterium]
MIDRKVLKEFQANIHEWDPFLRGIFSWMGYRSTIVNYDVAARAAGESKYGLRLLSHLAIAGTTSFSTFPLEVGIYIGIITLIASVLLFVTLFGMFLTQNEIHWSLFNANLIVFFGSIQICLLGMIGEYVGRIFLEQKQRPLYIVDETIGF